MNCSAKNCDRPSKYEIIYDCGPDPEQELILCEYHYGKDSAFQRNIKTMRKVE